jgi:hypothetical protein
MTRSMVRVAEDFLTWWYSDFRLQTFCKTSVFQAGFLVKTVGAHRRRSSAVTSPLALTLARRG